MAYLLDANAFIEAKNRFYGFDFCPAYWGWLEHAHAEGTVFSVERVAGEIEAGDDELVDWSRLAATRSSSVPTQRSWRACVS